MLEWGDLHHFRARKVDDGAGKGVDASDSCATYGELTACMVVY